MKFVNKEKERNSFFTAIGFILKKPIKNKDLWAGVTLIIILVAFYRDIVFNGRTFLMETAAPGTMPGAGPYKYEGVKPGFVANDTGAIAWFREPLDRFVSRSIDNGDFPLWNPHSGLAGIPLLADGQTGPLEPIQFLFFFVPDRFWPLAIDFQLLIRFFIAGFTCYLFARRRGINFVGSISSGVLFMLSSYFVTYGNHPQIKTESLLPLVLYGYDRLVDSKDKRDFWYCAVFVGWAIIAAMPESTFFGLLLGTLWYFYRSILQWRENGHLLQGAKYFLFRYLGSTLIGFLISAAYLLPFIEFVLLSKSIHAPGSGSEPYTIGLLPGLIFQIRTKLFLQVGFFAVFSLVFSLLHLKNWTQYRQHIIFFGTYAGIAILTLFGFPLTSWIRDLPVFNQLDFGKYPVPSIVFCLAILSGIFIDRAKHGFLSYIKLLISLLILLVIFVGIPKIRNLESVSAYSSDIVSISIASGLIIAILILLFLLAIYQRGRLFNPRLGQLVLLIMVIFEPFFWQLRINRPNRFDPFQLPPFVSFLQKDENFRIFGLDGTLYPNISTAYQLSDVRWLNALVSQRTFDFSTQFIEAREVNTIRFTGTRLPISDDMFNLLNVKYILKQNSYLKDSNNCLLAMDNQPYFGISTINPLILEQNQGKKNIFPELPLTINGATRLSIFAQPPQRLTVSLTLPSKGSELRFSIGLNPEVFSPEYGDGVNFKIDLLEKEDKVELFSKYIDPKNRSCDRTWIDESINLEKWSGKDVTLRFSTTGGPEGNIDYDWAYWGDLRFADPGAKKEIPNSSYNLVYQDQDVLIYQNRSAYPRAFLVHDLINVSSFYQALDILTNQEHDLRQTAIVENFPDDLMTVFENREKKLSSGSANIKQVTPDGLTVEVKTDSPSLLVLSEQYYPGWRAYADGKETRIYAVDGILRGIFLDEGEHTVILEYRPLSFSIGLVISITSLLVTVACLVHFYKQTHHKES